jgi:hypothetical protein
MEVHPPHAPLHSWKEFWIHLGTITVGLLIAISLEQSVEKLHHLHQRHELEEQLHAEGERNVEIVMADQRYFADMRVWQLELRKRVDAMRVSGGKAGLAYIANPVPGQPTIPSDSVWVTAKESALVVLLPQDEAAMYARIELQHKLLQDTIDRWFATRTAVETFEDNFGDMGPTSSPELSRMSGDELHTYSMLLTADLVSRDNVVFRLGNFLRLDQALLSGAKSEAELLALVTAKEQ